MLYRQYILSPACKSTKWFFKSYLFTKCFACKFINSMKNKYSSTLFQNMEIDLYCTIWIAIYNTNLWIVIPQYFYSILYHQHVINQMIFRMVEIIANWSYLAIFHHHYYHSSSSNLFSFIQFGSVSFSSVQFHSVRFSSIQCGSIQFNVFQFNSIQSGFIQFS